MAKRYQLEKNYDEAQAQTFYVNATMIFCVTASSPADAKHLVFSQVDKRVDGTPGLRQLVVNTQRSVGKRPNKVAATRPSKYSGAGVTAPKKPKSTPKAEKPTRKKSDGGRGVARLKFDRGDAVTAFRNFGAQRLDKDERALLKLVLGIGVENPLPDRVIGEQLNLSRAQVTYYKNRALAKLGISGNGKKPATVTEPLSQPANVNAAATH